MTSKAQEMRHKSGPGRSRKMRWLSGSSVAAAAFLLASAPQTSQAQVQLRAPGLAMANAAHGNNVRSLRPEMAQIQPHNRTPDFHARDIRISTPLNPLPVNNIRISAPINPLPVSDIRISAPISPLPVAEVRISAPAPLLQTRQSPDFNPRNIRISSPISLPAAYQPHQALPDFEISNVRISSPVELGLETIRISAPITLSGANQPQVPAGMVPINGSQAIAARISATQAFQANGVSASAVTTVSTAANADVVTVSGPETFINWAPLDTANSDDLINILPGGTSLTFVGPNSGYTVLSRILPTGTTTSGDPRGIAFSGNVSSRLGASNGPIGGNIWFYSPGGIVIGAGSTFDVGGLV
ncbi:MAG: hypothetical protein KBT59_07285, partial [Sphingomonadales bacterium]|nr:hypothetical protein [Sphingomonadales bacterium]